MTAPGGTCGKCTDSPRPAGSEPAIQKAGKCLLSKPTHCHQVPLWETPEAPAPSGQSPEALSGGSVPTASYSMISLTPSSTLPCALPTVGITSNLALHVPDCLHCRPQPSLGNYSHIRRGSSRVTSSLKPSAFADWVSSSSTRAPLWPRGLTCPSPMGPLDPCPRLCPLIELTGCSDCPAFSWGLDLPPALRDATPVSWSSQGQDLRLDFS